MSAKSALTQYFKDYPSMRTRGFLPENDPATQFLTKSPFAVLDQIGEAIPSRLEKKTFRKWAGGLEIPDWPAHRNRPEDMPLLRLYYVRLAFLVSAYVHQIGQPTAEVLPMNIAAPFIRACHLLGRRPILSYDGYALYNWRRIDPNGEVALGNIDTFQNFVDLLSTGGVNQESWFILPHIEIEAKAAVILASLERFVYDEISAEALVRCIADTVPKLTKVLKRIPEHMHSDDYFSKFRPYIGGFFKGLVYEGVSKKPKILRGETGAQSSIMPLLEVLLKIPHADTGLTTILADMRNYMPQEHSFLLRLTDQLPDMRDEISKETWNGALEGIAAFRSVHLDWAKEYIDRHGDSRGTGGSPYMQWLSQLRDETLAYRK